MKIQFAILLAIIPFLSSCDSKGDKAGPPSTSSSSGSDDLGYGRLTLESTSIKKANLNLADTNDLQNCFVSMDIYQGEGTCLTPLDLVGKGFYVEVVQSSQTDPDKGSARLASIGNAGESENGVIISGKEYSLSESTEFVAYNELFFNYPYKSIWNYVSVSNVYEKTKFYVGGKYVTMFIAAFQQPLAAWDVWASCNVSETTLEQSRFDDVEELKGMIFHRGDYLFCLKDSASEPCLAADYKWLNTANNQLVSSRPTLPRVNKWLVDDKALCEGNSERFDLNFNKLAFGAKLSKDFNLYADHSHGPMSNQWKDSQHPFEDSASADAGSSPFSLYYYKESGASTLDEGTKLEATLDFNSSQSLFIDGLRETDIDSATLETILAKVYPKSHWVLQKKAEGKVVGGSIDHFSSLSVTATISVSGGRTKQADLEKELE